MSPSATCQDCAWQGPVEQCGPLENACERVQPGDLMPAGECPKCNASALLDEHEPQLRVYTTRDPRSATHFTARAQALVVLRMMFVGPKAQKYRFAVQDIEEIGCRIAVYRAGTSPQMVPDGYLRVAGVGTYPPRDEHAQSGPHGDDTRETPGA